MAENSRNTIDLSMSWTVLYERSRRKNVDLTRFLRYEKPPIFLKTRSVSDENIVFVTYK